VAKGAQEKNARLFELYRAERDGVTFRPGAKDGSIPTHPVVPFPDIPESQVLSDCLAYLRARRIVCDRMNVGAGHLEGRDQFHTYGIPGAGDIMGLLRDGKHFEIECKRGKGGRLSKKQQERQEKVLQSNGVYVIVHGIPELEYYFKGLI